MIFPSPAAQPAAFTFLNSDCREWEMQDATNLQSTGDFIRSPKIKIVLGPETEAITTAKYWGFINVSKIQSYLGILFPPPGKETSNSGNLIYLFVHFIGLSVLYEYTWPTPEASTVEIMYITVYVQSFLLILLIYTALLRYVTSYLCTCMCRNHNQVILLLVFDSWQFTFAAPFTWNNLQLSTNKLSQWKI